MVLKTKLHPMNTISLAPLLVQVRQDGGRMCALASSADQLGLQENCTGSSVLGSEEQPFKALHHECHWAVVIQAGCSYFFGHRNDGGLLEARGYKDSYHCENWHQFVSRQYEDPPTDTILLVPWCFFPDVILRKADRCERCTHPNLCFICFFPVGCQWPHNKHKSCLAHLLVTHQHQK